MNRADNPRPPVAGFALALVLLLMISFFFGLLVGLGAR